MIVGRHVTWNNLEQVETRSPARFIEFASGSDPFLGWIGSCALLPTSYCTTDKDFLMQYVYTYVYLPIVCIYTCIR